MPAPDRPAHVPLHLIGSGLLLLVLVNLTFSPDQPAAQSAPPAVPADTTPPWRWPERAENLKVLPEHTTADELRRTMVGFAGALGVRCHHCHVGEEGKPFSQWDFASDEKPAKETARVMMRMVKDINETHLAALQDVTGRPAAERLAVSCQTCHHGQPRPLLLEDVLAGVLAAEGLDAALARYDALRQRYYGGFTYNFKATSLEALASDLLARQQVDATLAFLQRNLEHNPETGRTHRIMAEAYLMKGDTTAAVTHLERATVAEPGNPLAAQRLRQLGR